MARGNNQVAAERTEQVQEDVPKPNPAKLNAVKVQTAKHQASLGREQEEGASEISLELAQNQAVLGAQIKESEEQFRRGFYGICTICGRKIPELRMNALPSATTCMPCQQENEGGRGQSGSSSFLHLTDVSDMNEPDPEIEAYLE